MVKKRNSKVVSKNNTRQTSLAEKTEQILLTMPKIIATQIGKDLLVQKQQAAKLNLELKKVELQKKKLMQRLMELKNKTTAAAKKQARGTQKALQKITQVFTTLTRSVEFVQKQVQTLTQKKAKYVALQAQLISFQRDWVNKMTKQPQAKLKPKKKVVSSKSQSQQKKLTTVPNYPQETQVVEVIEIPSEDRVEFAQDTLSKVS